MNTTFRNRAELVSHLQAVRAANGIVGVDPSRRITATRPAKASKAPVAKRTWSVLISSRFAKRAITVHDLMTDSDLSA